MWRIIFISAFLIGCGKPPNSCVQVCVKNSDGDFDCTDCGATREDYDAPHQDDYLPLPTDQD